MEGMTEDMMKDSTEGPRGFGGTEVEEDDDQATESEQLDYELLSVRGTKMIFGPAQEKILKMLGSSESPAKAMGQAVSMIMKSLMDSAKKAGRNIAGETALEAGADLIDDLNELGKAKGIFQYDDAKSEEDEMADAALWGVKAYGDGMIANGEIDPMMTKAATEQVQAGLEEEGIPKKASNPIAEGVNQAVQPQGPAAAPPAPPPRAGVVGSQMQPTGGQ